MRAIDCYYNWMSDSNKDGSRFSSTAQHGLVRPTFGKFPEAKMASSMGGGADRGSVILDQKTSMIPTIDLAL